MGACYTFLLIVVILGPERINHDVILKDRNKARHSRTDEEKMDGDSKTAVNTRGSRINEQ